VTCEANQSIYKFSTGEKISFNNGPKKCENADIVLLPLIVLWFLLVETVNAVHGGEGFRGVIGSPL
jgi:hypothetical protein